METGLPKRVIFVCKKNTRRSQMAEGFMKHMLGETRSIHVQSAGLEAGQVAKEAVQVMQEAGVDISEQVSKPLERFDPADFDVVISLCGCGNSLPEAWKQVERQEDWEVTDPEGEDIDVYREVRDVIASRVEELMNSLCH